MLIFSLRISIAWPQFDSPPVAITGFDVLERLRNVDDSVDEKRSEPPV